MKIVHFQRFTKEYRKELRKLDGVGSFHATRFADYYNARGQRKEKIRIFHHLSDGAFYDSKNINSLLRKVRLL